MLRHTVATLAYRGAKAVRGAHGSFASFKASETTRTPAQILAHIGDLLDWALSIAKGNETWNNAEPLPWDKEVERFHAALKASMIISLQTLSLTLPAKDFSGTDC